MFEEFPAQDEPERAPQPSDVVTVERHVPAGDSQWFYMNLRKIGRCVLEAGNAPRRDTYASDFAQADLLRRLDVDVVGELRAGVYDGRQTMKRRLGPRDADVDTNQRTAVDENVRL